MTLQAKKQSDKVGPLYAKVKKHVLDRIMDGEFAVSERVPSENDLVKKFKISRMTANRALKELTEEGYLVRVAGVGTFVADFKSRGHLLEVRNIAADVEARGHFYAAELITNDSIPAPHDVAQCLGLRPGEKVFRTVVVHLERGVPIQLEIRYVNPAMAPGYGRVDFSKTTPGEYLLKSIRLQEAEHTVRACMPGAFVRERLHMEEGEPCLLLERLTWSDGQPVTRVLLYHPGTRFELSGRFRP